MYVLSEAFLCFVGAYLGCFFGFLRSDWGGEAL